MREQKIKQDICIGANIREIRRRQGLKQTDLVGLLQHIQASQLRAIKYALGTTYDELLEP